MHEQFRNTGKFNPIEYKIQHNFTTASIIKVHHYKVKSIQWKRKCEQVQQAMHLDHSFEYLCSQLDKDCIIEAHIQYETQNNLIQNRINVYGPITLQPDNNFLLENIYNEGQQFQVEIIRKTANYQCLLSVGINQLCLKSKQNFNGRQFFISMSDVVACYVDRTQNQEVIVFPTVYLRLIGLKLFNQIIYKGTYTQNNDPVKIKVVDPNIKLRPNLKWKRLLLKLNCMKQDQIRRASQLSSQAGKKIFQENKRGNQDYSHFQSNQNIQKMQRKRSEDILMKNDNLKKSSNFIESDEGNPQGQSHQQYFTQFQDLIYEDHQPSKDELALNDSFEKFQRQKKSQKQMEKILYVKAKKKQREDLNHKTKRLKQRLQELTRQKQQLLNINSKLKNQTERISLTSSERNKFEAINQAKFQVNQLKLQYERLIQQSNRKNNKKRQDGRYQAEKVTFH